MHCENSHGSLKLNHTHIRAYISLLSHSYLHVKPNHHAGLHLSPVLVLRHDAPARGDAHLDVRVHLSSIPATTVPNRFKRLHGFMFGDGTLTYEKGGYGSQFSCIPARPLKSLRKIARMYIHIQGLSLSYVFPRTSTSEGIATAWHATPHAS